MKFKCREFPGMEFETKEAMFTHLKANLPHIYELKRMEIKFSDSRPMSDFKTKSDGIAKGNGLEKGYIYPVINTTKYMDSHNDVHMDGIWDVSAKAKSNKVYYLANHNLEVGSIIAFPKDVEVFVKEVSWRSLGANFTGKTQALMFKISEKKIRNGQAREIIDEKIDIEHSVRMRYVKMFFAVDSEEEGFKAEKANWDKHINTIINSARAKEVGYFWGIEEAEIYKEGSMVIAGSNDVTPMIYPKSTPDPSNPDNEDTDPSLTDSQKQKRADELKRRRVY